MELEELYKLKKELLYHIAGTSYYMQEVLKIEEEIRKKELELRKENKNDNDGKGLHGM